MRLLRRGAAHARPKERGERQGNGPSPLPELGRRMIPDGGRRRNSDNGPVGLFVEIGLECFLFPLLPGCGCTEYAGPFLEQLALPLADPAGVQLVLAC